MGGHIQPLGNASINSFLSDSWNHYRQNMIAEDGRPLAEPDRNDLDLDGNTTERVTFSETAAYTLLRATWMNDQETFSRVWQWTQANLQRDQADFENWTWRGRDTGWIEAPQGSRHRLNSRYRNHLFAWRYVPTLNGGSSAGGVISYTSLAGETDRNGYNAASDDVEIAAALYFASLRGWGDNNGQQYLAQAEAILGDAWDNYVVEVAGQYYFFAGDQFSWAGELNPSYFRPAYFENVFPLIDSDHPWHLVAESSYDVLDQSGRMTINDLRGVNLPPDWLAMNYDGNLTESRFFPGTAGEIFGWDAFRALFAAAQDYAWFDDPSAREYLTNCETGPRCFLISRLSSNGRMPSGFSHNGSGVRVSASIERTHGLNQEQLAMYGAYLPFFHYAGEEEAAQSILDRLSSAYNSNGYWGNDRRDYYNQNWVWFGLMLTNGHPEMEPLLTQMRADSASLGSRRTVPTLEPPELGVLQFDARLGIRSDDRRPVLNQEALVENVSLEQLRDTLSLITSSNYSPLGSQQPDLELFRQINQIDQQNEHNLIVFLADPRQYWNNAITLATAYSQKLIREGRGEDMADAIFLLQDIRFRIEPMMTSLVRDPYAPHSYNNVLLQTAEAELYAQVNGQAIEHYQAGIDVAIGAIETMRNIDLRRARPDYYLISKNLMIIGDLYLRMHESSRDRSYLEEAAYYYTEISHIDARVQIYDPVAGLDITFGWPEINESILFNRDRGHLSEDDFIQAEPAMCHLQAVARVKIAALSIQSNGQRNIGNILGQILSVNLAIDQIQAGTEGENDFYLSFANNVKADLLLFLADSIKYGLWPYSTTAEAANALRAQLSVAHQAIFEAGPQGQGELLNIIVSLETVIHDLTSSVSLTGRTSDPQQAINNIFALNAQLIDQARLSYAETPSQFAYLYAWAQTKNLEIVVRTGEFMGRAFRFLVPFHTDPVLMSRPIPQTDFLGVEQNHLRALLLASSENETEALQLLQQVITDSESLTPRYRTYYQLHARLKIAEIHANSDDSSLRNRAEAERLFAQIERQLDGLSAQDLREMAWRPASFRAELYHEWADLTGSRIYAARALELCYQSDSPYDFTTRRQYILRRFRSLVGRDAELQRTYGRRPENGR